MKSMIKHLLKTVQSASAIWEASVSGSGSSADVRLIEEPDGPTEALEMPVPLEAKGLSLETELPEGREVSFRALGEAAPSRIGVECVIKSRSIVPEPGR